VLRQRIELEHVARPIISFDRAEAELRHDLAHSSATKKK
jgi:hypothetical protein